MSGRKANAFQQKVSRALQRNAAQRLSRFGVRWQRNQMLRLADDYDRKALQAEEIEATLRAPHDESPSLISRDSRSFCKPIENRHSLRTRV